MAVSPSAELLAVAVLIAGSGAGLASPALVTLVEGNVDEVRRDQAQAMVNSGTGVGVTVAGPLALLLSEDWRTAWWVIAACCAVATIATLRADQATRPERPAATAPGDARAREPLAFAIAAAALVGFASAAAWTFGRSVVITSGQLGAAEATVFWTVLGGSGVGGAFSGDLIARCGVRTGWIVTAVSVGSATAVLGAFPSVAVVTYLAAGLFGASYVALTGVLIAWASRTTPGNAGPGTAVLFIALAVGQAGGAAVLGRLLDAVAPALVFSIAGLCAVLSLLPALRGTHRIGVRRARPARPGCGTS